MLSDVDGVLVGHWTHTEARTGCTVVLLPAGTVASGEIRGGAPATREFGLLEPWRMVPAIDAVVLSGGSAFGLAACDGVMRWLEEQGRGFETSVGRVPIVVGMSLFDLGVGDPSVRPGPDQGRAAAEAATGSIADDAPVPASGPAAGPAAGPVAGVARGGVAGAEAAGAASGPVAGVAGGGVAGAEAAGQVGAGTGATVGKWGGPDHTRAGGLVSATVRSGEVVVSSLLAVNAYGWVDDGTSVHDPGPPVRPAAPATSAEPDPGGATGEGSPATSTNTTIGVVVTNARLDKVGCHLLAQAAHDGLARSLFPAHTSADGDAVVAAATGQVDPPDVLHLRLLAQLAVTRAVRTLLANPPTL